MPLVLTISVEMNAANFRKHPDQELAVAMAHVYRALAAGMWSAPAAGAIRDKSGAVIGSFGLKTADSATEAPDGP